MNEDTDELFYGMLLICIGFGLIMFLVGFLVGADSGYSSGAKKACETVKLEWVVDKCMKVTRSEV